MLRRRAHRLATALFVVFSLLASQWALASYSCPQMADLEAMAAMMDSGQPCAGMDTVQPALCHEHAADPGKTFQAAKLPALGEPAVVHVLQRPPLELARQACPVPPTACPEAQPPPDPLFLATLRLRV